MNKVAALLIFGCLAITVCAQTKTRQCRGFRQLRPDEVSLTNCRTGVCKLKRKTEVVITLNFTPDQEIKQLTTNVEALIGNFPVPFIGVDGTSACDYIFDKNGKKASCPLKKGESYTYKRGFNVLEAYPQIQVVVHWALKQGNKDYLCFEVPARIV